MEIQIDNNHLLSIFNPQIPQTKEYTYTVSGYTFSDYDRGMIVLHKKDFKIVNLKNLGDGMNVVYFQNHLPSNIHLDGDALQQAFGLFSSFDETTGKTYCFIPNASEKEVPEKNQMFEKLDIKNRLTKTEKGITTDGLPFTGTDHRISFLFGLLLLYGKLDAKKGELASIKMHIPLFGQYMKHADMLDTMVGKLQEHGLFVKADKLVNNNGITYQISSNDFELLEIYAGWYEAVEKFEKITKRDFTQDMKIKLIEFLETNVEIPSEGKNKVLEKIKNSTIKFLIK